MSRNGNTPATIPDRLQPHDLEAEQALIGSIVIGEADAMLLVAGVGLQPGDFFIERHGDVFKAVQVLYDGRQPIDLLSIGDELARQRVDWQREAAAYLTGLINATPSYMHAEYYARRVKSLATLRQLIEAAGKISRAAFDETAEPGQVLEQAKKLVFDIGQANSQARPKSARELCMETVDHVDRLAAGQAPGISTGLIDLDRMTGGLQPGDVAIIAARPSMGKTALAGQLALTAARAGCPALINSLEMSGLQVIWRFIAASSGQAGVTVEDIRTGRVNAEQAKLSALRRGAEAVQGLPLWIDDRSRYIADIVAGATLHHYRHGLKLLVIDYIQLIRTRQRSENRNQELSSISKDVKALARELGIPVILISQLNRDVESRHDKRPMLSDLRESGAIEEDADIVMLMYRDDYYNQKSDYPGVTEINVAKNRQGKTGLVQLLFRKSQNEFVSFAKEVQGR